MKRSLTILNVLLVLAMALSLFPLSALADETVPTKATIDPAGSPPVTAYKWELVDMQSGNGFQKVDYIPASGQDIHDDQPTVPGIQVFPNLEDQPEVRWLDYWWVATDPNGINDLIDGFVRVFHPDGTMKYQLHGADACAMLSGPPFPVGGVLEAAIHTGQLTSAQASDIVTNCGKKVWKVYHVVGELSKHQPYGVYTVHAQAVDQAGNTSDLVNKTLEVLPIIGLRTDFTAVDFGSILPNTMKWIRGDFTFGTDNLPTVKNVGNAMMFLSLEFSPMVGANLQKVIDTFDAFLDVTQDNVVNGQVIDPMAAKTTYCFDDAALGSNVLGQLDLSIHPGSIPGDTYAGTLSVYGSMACPMDEE